MGHRLVGALRPLELGLPGQRLRLGLQEVDQQVAHVDLEPLVLPADADAEQEAAVRRPADRRAERRVQVRPALRA